MFAAHFDLYTFFFVLLFGIGDVITFAFHEDCTLKRTIAYSQLSPVSGLFL